MKLTDYYLQGVAAHTEAKASQASLAYMGDRQEQKTKFSSVLNAAKTDDRFRAKPNQEAAVDRENDTEGAQAPARELKTDAPVKPLKAGKAIKKAAGGNTGNEVKADELEQKTVKTNEEMASEIADALGVPLATVMQALAALGITAFELENPENLSAFMLVLNNAESPAELLAVPEIAEQFEAVKAVVEGYAGDMPAEGALKLQDAPSAPVTPKTLATKFVAPNAPDTAKRAASKDGAVIDGVTVETGEEPLVYAKSADKPLNMDLTPRRTNAEQRESAANVSGAQTPETAVTSNVSPAVAGTGTQNPGSNGGLDAGTGSGTGLAANTGVVSNDGAAMFNVVTNAEMTEVAEAVKAQAKAADPAEIVKQIVEKLKVDFRQDVTEIKLTLKPESLGDVSLKISVQNGVVTAQFTAESQRVKEIIESNFAELKNSLNEKGVQVSELTVFVGQNGYGDDGGRRETEKPELSSRRISQIIGGAAVEAEAEAPPAESPTDQDGNLLKVNMRV